MAKIRDNMAKIIVTWLKYMRILLHAKIHVIWLKYMIIWLIIPIPTSIFWLLRYKDFNFTAVVILIYI